MRVRYLVDTDWAIQYLRGDAGIVGRLEELKPEGLGLSVISLAELYEGIFSSRDSHASEAGLNNFGVGCWRADGRNASCLSAGQWKRGSMGIRRR